MHGARFWSTKLAIDYVLNKTVVTSDYVYVGVVCPKIVKFGNYIDVVEQNVNVDS